MKNFGKGLLIILGCIVGVPLLIVVICALFGFGALFVAIPEVMVGIVAVLLLISIPGLIVGLLINHKK